MFSQNAGYSLADIAAATGNNNNNYDGFGGGAWWIIILFLFVFMGGGWDGGFGNGNGAAAATAAASGALTRSDLCQEMNFQGVEDGVRGIQQGLCDGFYSTNTAILSGFDRAVNNNNQGFAGLNTAIVQDGNATREAIQSNMIANMQNTNALTAQLTSNAFQNQQCCCETQRLIDKGFCETNYNMATQDCQTRQAISNSTRDIIDSQNAGTRAIIEFLTQDKIASLSAENSALKAAASNAAQTTAIVNQLRPAPAPAYVVPNPYGYNNFGSYGCGGCC
jgi:hypothetical protein